MFKVAYCAGHDLSTPGKRVPKKLDPAQTREWVLNDRVARYFNERMLQYDGVQTMRTDDSTGKKEIEIKDRTAAANAWGADLYIDMHHNAGAKLTNAGGVVVYSYPGSKKGREYRDAIYAAVIEAGGLKGNRSNPKKEKAYKSLKLAKAPAVLIEYGFMDSRADYPVISTEEYARKVGYATADAVAKIKGLAERDSVYTLEQFVLDVQKAVGATVDGIPGPETLSKTPTISEDKNRKHKVVIAVQKRLWRLGYQEVGEADGIAGPKFTKAVIALQKDYHCVKDGEITARNKTWKVLLGMEV